MRKLLSVIIWYYLYGVWGVVGFLPLSHCSTLTWGHPEWCVSFLNLAGEGILFIVCHRFKTITFITFQTAVWSRSVKHEQVSVCWLSANPKDTFSLFTTNDRQYWFPLESLTVIVQLCECAFLDPFWASSWNIYTVCTTNECDVFHSNQDLCAQGENDP